MTDLLDLEGSVGEATDWLTQALLELDDLTAGTDGQWTEAEAVKVVLEDLRGRVKASLEPLRNHIESYRADYDREAALID